MKYTFITTEEDTESINSEKHQEIIVLRKKVMMAEQDRIRGIETMSIAEAKERLRRRFE